MLASLAKFLVGLSFFKEGLPMCMQQALVAIATQVVAGVISALICKFLGL